MENAIDLPQAIYAINPTAEYRLDQSVPPHHIVEWRGPGAQPTELEIIAAWAHCAQLTVTGNVVNIDAHADIDSIELVVGAETVTVALVDGIGALQVIFPDGALERVVRFADVETFGDAEVTVYA